VPKASIRTLGIAAALIVCAAVLALYFRHRPEPPAPPAHAPQAPLFARWLQYESADPRTQPYLQDYFLDATLGHQVFPIPPQGVSPAVGRELMLDDDQLLLSSGRRLWTRELLNQPGLAGKFCYLHSGFCLKRLFDVQFFVDGKPVVRDSKILTLNQTEILKKAAEYRAKVSASLK
jgi:hypothetical protein